MVDEVEFHRCPGTNIGEWWFPLRRELQVKLFLPLDLTTREVERLRKFIEALVTDEPEETV